jgi:hypothetical protein
LLICDQKNKNHDQVNKVREEFKLAA